VLPIVRRRRRPHLTSLHLVPLRLRHHFRPNHHLQPSVWMQVRVYLTR
jgi:hypothetical protein